MGVPWKKEKKTVKKVNIFYTLNINARLQSFDRADIYADRIDDEIISAGIGEIDGGCSLLNTNGEIVSCDVDIVLNNEDSGTFNQLIEILNKFEFPKGSRLSNDDGIVLLKQNKNYELCQARLRMEDGKLEVSND